MCNLTVVLYCGDVSISNMFIADVYCHVVLKVYLGIV